MYVCVYVGGRGVGWVLGRHVFNSPPPSRGLVYFNVNILTSLQAKVQHKEDIPTTLYPYRKYSYDIMSLRIISHRAILPLLSDNYYICTLIVYICKLSPSLRYFSKTRYLILFHPCVMCMSKKSYPILPQHF